MEHSPQRYPRGTIIKKCPQFSPYSDVLDELIPLIEHTRKNGATVVLKWDGERTQKVGTVVITQHNNDYVWHEDTDNVVDALARGLNDYRKK